MDLIRWQAKSARRRIAHSRVALMLAVGLCVVCLAGWPRLTGATASADSDAASKLGASQHAGADAVAAGASGVDALHHASAAAPSASASVTTVPDAPPPSGKNLLVNGDLSQGSGDAPDGWRHDGWILTPDTTTFRWLPPRDGHPGRLEVDTRRDNDARWVQSLNLQPGWYYFSAEASAKDVLPFKTGANVSLLEDNIVSDNLKGTVGWHRLGFYLKVGESGADVDFALRLGGYMNVTRGDVFFRDPSVVKITAPPPGADYVYDLEKVRRSETAGPIGQLWTLVATFVVFGLLGVFGWRMYDGVKPAAASGQHGADAVKRERDGDLKRETTTGRSRR